MRCRWGGPALLSAAVCVVAGCGGGGSSGATAGPTSTPSPSVSASATPTPSPSPTPSPTGPNRIASLTPTAALAKVSAAAATQTSVRVVGSVVESGRKLSINVQAGLNSGQGVLRIGNGHVSLRLLNGTLYFNGDLKGLTGLGVKRASAKGAAGKWIGGQATTSPLSAFVSFTDLVSSILRPNGRIVAGRPKTINGVKTFALVTKSKKGGGTLYIATIGEPLPVQAVNPKTRETLTFTDWSATLSVAQPPKAITVPPSSPPSAPVNPSPSASSG
jgi:hypothetical protein